MTAARGRPALVERIVALLRPLLRYARSELRRREVYGELPPGLVQAEDVVDAGLVDALRHAADAPADRFYPWLRGFVRRAIAREVDAARRRRREVSLEHAITAESQRRPDSPPLRLVDVLPDPGAPPDQIAQSAELQDALETLLAQVPAQWREPFALHLYERLPLREVARLERLPVADVRRRLERARAFLRARLADEYADAAPPPSETLLALLKRPELTAEHVARVRGRLMAVAA